MCTNSHHRNKSKTTFWPQKNLLIVFLKGYLIWIIKIAFLPYALKQSTFSVLFEAGTHRTQSWLISKGTYVIVKPLLVMQESFAPRNCFTGIFSTISISIPTNPREARVANTHSRKVRVPFWNLQKVDFYFVQDPIC